MLPFFFSLIDNRFLAEVAAASLQNSMDPDNLGRVFAPTLFRAPPSSKDVDPLIAFQEVNLQKNVIKFLISQQMNHDGGLSISSFQFNNRMMSRIQRGNDDESGEEVDLPVKSDHHSQTREDISLQEQLLDDRNGDGDHWNDDVLAESGIDERCCIVSYDLREELGMHSLHDHTRDDIMATAHQQLRQFRLEQNSLPNSDSPNDDLQPPVSPLVPLNDHVSSIPGDESKQQNLVEELRERSESTERYSTSLPRDQLLNDAREQVRQFLLERERDTKEEEVSVPLSTSNDLEIKEAESPDSSL